MVELQEVEKREAAERAVQEVRDGMVVGLGSGSTARIAIHLLSERVRAGLSVTGVPTSVQSEQLARSLGMRIVDLQTVEHVDLTIDGADEIVPETLAVLKGYGGALVREKLVAAASQRVVIVADGSKVVDRLGERHAVPVEVVPFGWRFTARSLERLGGRPHLRVIPSGHAPFVTDNGNYILDADFGPVDEPRELAKRIKALTGVVDHGIFVDCVSQAVIAGRDGVAVLSLR